MNQYQDVLSGGGPQVPVIKAEMPSAMMHMPPQQHSGGGRPPLSAYGLSRKEMRINLEARVVFTDHIFRAIRAQ